ncbi:MAG: FkbM family methyltransferase, partial [Methylobacillus sp.]|jgi:hypothetical protein|nr:FkbM family methyltransferase [Methylobacillus sp.]
MEKYRLPAIHFLSLDVEGFEEEVFKGFDLAKYRPWIICAEAVLPWSSIRNDTNWYQYVINSGYTEVHFDGYNRFFVANEFNPRPAAA